MKKPLLKVTVFLLFFFFTSTYSQSRFSHEVGVIFGASSFQLDYGISGDFPSANQASMAFGITHYLKFFGSQYSWRSGSSYFSDHFKLKTEFLYTNNSNIVNEATETHGDAIKEALDAMTGTIKMYDISTSLQFYFLELEDYSSYFKAAGSLNPFISVGLHYSIVDPDILVDGNSLKGRGVPVYPELIPKWQEGAVHFEDNNTFGASFGAGLRYSLDNLDLLIDGRYQYFFSDEVEALNAPTDPGNNNNDTMIVINFGVVYVFGKY
jgi:hypothetical protein